MKIPYRNRSVVSDRHINILLTGICLFSIMCKYSIIWFKLFTAYHRIRIRFIHEDIIYFPKIINLNYTCSRISCFRISSMTVSSVYKFPIYLNRNVFYKTTNTEYGPLIRLSGPRQNVQCHKCQNIKKILLLLKQTDLIHSQTINAVKYYSQTA